MCIIQADYSNVFESLSQTVSCLSLVTDNYVYFECWRGFSIFQDYSTALDLMQKMILATDLANHFKIDKQIENIISGL